jgi:hypothetical protein
MCHMLIFTVELISGISKIQLCSSECQMFKVFVLDVCNISISSTSLQQSIHQCSPMSLAEQCCILKYLNNHFKGFNTPHSPLKRYPQSKIKCMRALYTIGQLIASLGNLTNNAHNNNSDNNSVLFTSSSQ